MADCDLTALQASACANGFDCLAENPKLALAVELVLLQAIAGTSYTAQELLDLATAAKYTKLSVKQLLAVQAQLLCDINSG